MCAGALHQPRFGGSSRTLRFSGLFCGALAALGPVSACQNREPPDLLSVHRLDPPRASAGDRVVLRGEGFPDGRPATATFRGDLFRPGTAPETDVRIVAAVVPTDRDGLTIVFDRSLERRFVGSGDSALHTTFRGDVRVTFQPRAAGLAQVSGTLHDVRFDVLPSSSGSPPPGAEPEPSRALPFLGAAATLDPAGGGLRITSVDPDGRAAAAGILAGDRLMDLEGVTVLSEGDLRARGGQHLASIVVERGGRLLPALPLDVEGLAPRGAADLVGPAAVIVPVCATVGLLATRFGLVLRWLARLAELFGSRRVARARVGLSMGIAPALLAPTAEWRALGAAAFLVLVGVAGALLRLSFGHWLLAPDLDLVVLTLGGAGPLLVTRSIDGGRREDGGWSLTRALAAAGRTLACLAPGLAAVGGGVLASGRFVLGEMVADQGGAPWRWAGARNPGLFVLLVVLVATAVPEADDSGALPAVEGLGAGASIRPSASRVLVRLAEWSYLWMTCGLVALLFLGGWRVPGVSSMAQEGSRWLTGLGAALLLVKLWGTAFGVGVLRRAAGRLAVEHVALLAARWVLPVAIAAFALGAAWTALLDGARSNLAADLAGYTAIALATTLFGFLGLLAVRSRTRLTASTSVNPWL
jgi:NADH-quinone oxidoreductase subunit H